MNDDERKALKRPAIDALRKVLDAGDELAVIGRLMLQDVARIDNDGPPALALRMRMHDATLRWFEAAGELNAIADIVEGRVRS